MDIGNQQSVDVRYHTNLILNDLNVLSSNELERNLASTMNDKLWCELETHVAGPFYDDFKIITEWR